MYNMDKNLIKTRFPEENTLFSFSYAVFHYSFNTKEVTTTNCWDQNSPEDDPWNACIKLPLIL